MKRLFAPAWLSAWLTGLIPDRLFWIGKKTPWYRRSWMTSAPWLAPALVAPFAGYLIWKLVARLRSGTKEQSA